MARTINTPVGSAPLLPVMIMSLGGYLCWFGVHYWRSDTTWPSDPLKAVLTGKPIPVPDRSSGQAALKTIVRTAGAGGGGGAAGPGAGAPATGGGEQIAAQAMKYLGQGYVFGGPADRPGNWDCSSYASYVLGHDLGYKLPGGKWGDPGFPPHTHGPTTNSYLLYGQPVTASEARRGDLVVSSEHMGIVTGAGTYVSARTPTLGTGVGLYTRGFPGGSPVFRRVT